MPKETSSNLRKEIDEKLKQGISAASFVSYGLKEYEKENKSPNLSDKPDTTSPL